MEDDGTAEEADLLHTCAKTVPDLIALLEAVEG